MERMTAVNPASLNAIGEYVLDWMTCSRLRYFNFALATPQEALAAMIHLNNKYALDGRDPNSCNGVLIFSLERYARPCGGRSARSLVLFAT